LTPIIKLRLQALPPNFHRKNSPRVTSDLSIHSHNLLIWECKAWMFSRAILG